MKYIDNLLNSLTMYRLVLYGLTILFVLALGLAFSGLLPFTGFSLLISAVVILAGCALSNSLFSWAFKIPANIESSYITAYILIFLLPPPDSAVTIATSLLVAIIAVVSKYIINIKGKHIFNPVAIAAVLLGASGLGAASWWIGSSILLLPTAILGLLMVRKVRWSWLFLAFIASALLSILLNGTLQGSEVADLLTAAIISGPLLFFGTIMLTEPSTTPPTRNKQITYGILVGILYGTPFHIGPIYNAPELALVIGNIFSYVVSPKGRLILQFKEKVQLAPLIYDFVFTVKQKLNFQAGQYMEWTIHQKHGDSRGNRRFFTIASSPTEDELRIGVKVPEQSSSYKQHLLHLQKGDTIAAGHLSGDFTLPASNNSKIVAIAGGIGITPFRSMVKQALDTQNKLDMILFYACSDVNEFVYKDIFTAGQTLGVKTLYVLSGDRPAPANWEGISGYLTKEIILDKVPDYKTRTFYLSGPNIMVDAYKKLLLSMSISRQQIHTDYFPGY